MKVSEDVRRRNEGELTICNIAMLLRDGQAACIQLSSNAELVHYGEQDVERIRLYMNQIMREPDPRKHDAIRTKAGQGNHKVGLVMKSTGSYAVLKTLMPFSNHFLGPSGLTTTWLGERLCGITGGVSVVHCTW